MSPKVSIDKSRHEEIPSWGKRLKNALVAMVLGFGLFQIIGFWMFPGIGINAAFQPMREYFPFSFLNEFVNIVQVTFITLCGVFGWFGGKYVTDRLNGYFDFWKFW